MACVFPVHLDVFQETLFSLFYLNETLDVFDVFDDFK